MVAVTCERVSDEHAAFVFTILKDYKFTDPDMLKKFQGELLFFNNLMWVLFTVNLEFCQFLGQRTLRDI